MNNTVQIGNFTWNIAFLEKDQEEDKENERSIMGLCDFLKQTIFIRRNLPADLRKLTIIHEVTHATAYSFGYHIEDEEAMCDFIGAQLYVMVEASEQIGKIIAELEEEEKTITVTIEGEKA